jgi:hypothetical protein
MALLRARLSWLAAFWLGCQIAGFVAAPVVFAVSESRLAADEDCECPGTAPGQACPMHKGHGKTTTDETECALRNACAPSDAALLTICGSIGILPGLPSAEVDRTAEFVAASVLNPISQSARPEGPPPRA